MLSRLAALRLLGLWRHPDFQRFWTSETVSQFGTQGTLLAVPLTAALLLDATPPQMGALGAMGGTAAFLAGFLAGPFVDRLRLKPLLVGADLSNAAILLTVPVAWAVGVLGMAHLYAVEFLVGGLSTVSYVAAQSWLPSVVGRERLVEANGKLRVSEALSQTAGPSLAGGLAQIVGAPFVLVLDALSYLASARLLGSVRAAEPSRVRTEEASASASERGIFAAVRPTAAELTEGLRFTLGNPVLRALLASSVTFNIFGGFFAALFVIFATRELGLPPAALGAILAVQGVGGVLGALFVGRTVRRLGQGPVLVLTGAGQGVGWLALPAAGAFGLPSAPTLALALAISGFSFVAYVVGAVSLRQELTPDELLGRVNAGSVSLILAAVPFGSLAGGLLATGLGTRTALACGALLGASGFLWTLLSPVRRLGDAGREVRPGGKA